MKYPTIIPALLSLTLATLPIPIPIAHNGADSKSIKVVHTDQTLVLDADWTYFLFTNVGVPVTPNFIIPPSGHPIDSQIQVVDLFCAGDIFQLFNNGSELLSSISPPYAVDCQLSTDDPNLAISQEYWSRLLTDVYPDTSYNLTIYATASPWSAGKAAIRWVNFPP